ncbi:uncharacterized protein [Miscanthus floridulus]|uniref:uncharacterized protein n=1 Tax=Miscanthus floridulus TaxID=154761 RepID=UPI0034576641
MLEEMKAIEENEIWQLIDPPLGCHPINLKWVYKVKRDKLSAIVKHKARLVIRGFIRCEGIDFKEVSRAWNAKLDAMLGELRFQRCATEHVLYMRGWGKEEIVVGVYVDDLIITGVLTEDINSFKREMVARF